MPRTVHVIGNGDSSALYQNEPRKGLKLLCNKAPFEVPGAYASCIVDFKMTHFIHKGQVDVPGEWVMGVRPKEYMARNPQFHLQRSHQIKMFYTKKPKYAKNYTDFNCGHFAGYFAMEHLKAEVLHLYGMDSIFDFSLRSYTDFYINSDRGNMNNNRLSDNWRPLWKNMFEEFKDTKIYLHHFHNALKFDIPSNVEIITYGGREEVIDVGHGKVIDKSKMKFDPNVKKPSVDFRAEDPNFLK